MTTKKVERRRTSQERLTEAVSAESRKFEECYRWLEKSMPSYFFEEIPQDTVLLIAHSLMGFHLQGHFSTINLPRAAIVLCLDSHNADVQVLKSYRNVGIKNYRAYISDGPPPACDVNQNLRIATIYFTEAVETIENPFSEEAKEELRRRFLQRNEDCSVEDFEELVAGMNNRFLSSLRTERLVLALEMFVRARTRDHCQYEVRYNEDWESQDLPSMQIVLAWRNTPKHSFLFQLARTVLRHGLVMKTVNATYINPYDRQTILVMALGLHGADGRAAWDVASLPDFLRELVTLKYFDDCDRIDDVFVEPRILSGNAANLLRSMVNFIHQALVHIDPYIYSLENVEEALCRHPELTVKLCSAFDHKFDPDACNLKQFEKTRKEFMRLVDMLDTGQEANDVRRKNILHQGMNFVDHVLKTNYYRNNKTAISFRLDPQYLDHIPFERKAKFPDLPYAIFYVRGMRFFGFHIRFKDLSRGGLRTVFPAASEQAAAERNTVFTECYNLAHTQQKKNKDIPEGGSKGLIFLRPFDRLDSETSILKSELAASGVDEEVIDVQLEKFRKEQKVEYLHQSQRSFIESLITIINSEPDGEIRAKHIIDYWKRPEYIYLGPDENMHDPIISWIASFSRKYGYKPGGAFISSKPEAGINHKQYGVTSLGVNVYVHETLKYLGFDPEKDLFTVKMSGGPDGDVAGNEIVNLHRCYPRTARLLALTDGTGTINDPQGLNLEKLVHMFEEGQGIKFYPPELLSDDGFLLDRTTKKDETAYTQLTLCWRMKDGKLVEDWVSGSEMNRLFRDNVHHTRADIFIPGGGRPRTLNANNVTDFLDEDGHPTSRAIVEGANLYLTPEARRFLEDQGVIIIKDSSANKGGVICSSFEVLCGLTIGEDLFVEQKDQLVKEILDRLQDCALSEAQLMLRTHKQTGDYLTDISDKISENINKYTYKLLDYLETVPLSNDPNNPLIRCFLSYALPTLRKQYSKQLLTAIPDHHKKAIISCFLAARLVYKKGLDWQPSIVDILPLVLEDPSLNTDLSDEDAD